MGEVKETIKGSSSTDSKNILNQISDISEELRRLTKIKDDDVLEEGKEQYPENVRKSAILRSVNSLLVAVKVLLEDY